MTKPFITFLTLIVLTLAVSPLTAIAEPSEHHHSKRMPALDWKAYPADIQVLKQELDRMRSKQKLIFQQMKSQYRQIRNARKALTPEQRTALKNPASKIAEQIKASRMSILALRKQKHAAWDQFRVNAEAKRWDAAKSDLQSIITLKGQIIEKQQDMLQQQQKMIALLSASSALRLGSYGEEKPQSVS